MGTFNRILLAVSMAIFSACSPQALEVSRPFYLTYIENSDDSALFRCPKGPGNGCAIDGLPGPYVFAAGADSHFVVVARYPKVDGAIDRTRTEYFYFARIPEETSGWGRNPERIIGPLTASDFNRAKAENGLPEFSVDVRRMRGFYRRTSAAHAVALQ